jgi:hypothetical protein
MNRRDLLKVLGAMPLASALGACGHAYSKLDSEKGSDKSDKQEGLHSLQILLEGPFAVVLQKNSQRLTAFVPLADPKRTDLAHEFYFNDPHYGNKPDEKSKAYKFTLSGEGLHNYQTPDAYINPDFHDFSAETANWHMPPSLVILDLPVPRSINFGGRPLKVKFGKNAIKPEGLMPTNYIFEYRIDEPGRVQLKCDNPRIPCGPSPHCPPGVMRYYFGVGQENKDPKKRQAHAVAFFNFMVAAAFPDLAQKYELVEIEESDYPMPRAGGSGGRTYPTSLETTQVSARLMPAILRGRSSAPRLVPVASLVDCQSGGILVKTGSGPNG